MAAAAGCGPGLSVDAPARGIQARLFDSLTRLTYVEARPVTFGQLKAMILCLARCEC